MPTLTKQIIAAAILGFEEQKRRLDEQITELRGMLSGTPTASSAAPESAEKRPRRKMSAATRKAMAEGQRKRWAAKAQSAPEAAMVSEPKRKLSAAGRAAIVAALKKRWAAKKAAK